MGTIRTVQYNTTERLACACCLPAPVHLKIGVNQTIPATLVHATALAKSKCSPGSSFQYSFTYDDAVLPGDATSIVGTDITGVLCEGAITAWVNQLIASAVQPQILRVTEHVGTIDMTAWDSGDFEDVDLVLTNPSALRSMNVDVFFRWNLLLRSTVAFGYCGIKQGVLVDGAAILEHPTFYNLHDSNFQWAVAAPGLIDMEGGSGIAQVTLAPSESKTFTLRLYKIVSSIPEPDTHYWADRIFLYAMGITI